MKKNAVIITILSLIIIIETIMLTYVKINKIDCNENDSMNSETTETVDSNEEEKNTIGLNTQASITNLMNENFYLSFMKFTNPESLLKENIEFNKNYLLLELQYSKYVISSQELNLPNSVGITLENLKNYLKEKFNYTYSDTEIREYFKELYNQEENLYLIGVSGGLIPPIIETMQAKNNEYHITIYLESDIKHQATVIIKEENNKYYFYSSTGIDYYS